MDDTQNIIRNTEFSMDLEDLMAICVVAATGCRAFFNSPLMADVAGAVADALEGKEWGTGSCAYTKYVGVGQCLNMIPRLPGTRVVVHDMYCLSSSNLVDLRLLLDICEDTHVIIGGDVCNNLGTFDEIVEKNKWAQRVFGGVDFNYTNAHLNGMRMSLYEIMSKAYDMKSRIESVGSPWFPGYDPATLSEVKARMHSDAVIRAEELNLFDGTMRSAKVLTLAYAKAMYSGSYINRNIIQWVVGKVQGTSLHVPNA